MKIIQLAYSNYIGGASKAAYRIHYSLCKNNIDSELWVNETSSKKLDCKKPYDKIEKKLRKLRRYITWPLLKTIKTTIPIHHSISLLPSNWVKRINESDADIVNLHWIQREMLSIEDISKIKKPIVWTLHDMWAFCGAEHYTNDNRWREGYNFNNRPSYESGFDLNKWTWRRKQKYWKNPIQIITPSLWLANCARESKLMSNWPVSVVANPLNTEVFKPMDKKIALKKLNLPNNVPLILFGALGGDKDHRKGFDLLIKALEHLKNEIKVEDMEIVVLGQSKPKSSPNLGFPIHYMGCLNDDISLRLVYSSVDAMVIPSRQDNLPNMGVEAQACGIPVIAFNIGGLPDIVEHKKTGYLAEPFNTEDLANGIMFIIDQSKTKQLANNARERAIKKFSEKRISEAYLKIYEKLLI
jgi:glycosyltransferase involved in cell wall biosynthesis